MKVYKFDKDFKGCIEPMPGDVVELDGARLKVVGECTPDNKECCDCFLKFDSCHVSIDKVLQGWLCIRTMCEGVIREDGLGIHYEEVKDEERV